MIKVHCFTKIPNLVNEKWPTELQTLPNKGDIIKSANNIHLVVYSITHEKDIVHIELTLNYL